MIVGVSQIPANLYPRVKTKESQQCSAELVQAGHDRSQCLIGHLPEKDTPNG